MEKITAYEEEGGVETKGKEKRRSCLTVITSFYDKQRNKQVDFERKVLRDLTFSDIEHTAESQFAPFIQTATGYQTSMEEVCIDYAVEAYLLGASFSRFGYYGESLGRIRSRSEKGQRALVNDLYDYWCYWSEADAFMLESVYEASQAYIADWWRRGFENGEKRYRLRLN